MTEIWWCEEHQSELRTNWKTQCWKKVDWVYLEGDCRMVQMRLTPADEVLSNPKPTTEGTR